MECFQLVAKNFWVLAIIITGLNFFLFKKQARDLIKTNPEFAPGFRKLFGDFFIWVNIPWIIMGWGMTVGTVPNIFYYFRPQDGNPYVLAWYISIFTLWIAGTYWLIFKGGAEMLTKHPLAFNQRISKPIYIKILWLLCLIWGLAGVIFLYTNDMPLPP